jgi:hypothetical protein
VEVDFFRGQGSQRTLVLEEKEKGRIREERKEEGRTAEEEEEKKKK